MENLIIYEKNKKIEFSHKECLENHKGTLFAGVALSYKMLSSFLTEENRHERGGWYFYTGIGKNGQAIIDTAKFVLGEDTIIDISEKVLEKVQTPEGPNGGKYYFLFENKEQGKRYTFQVKEGMVPEEFYIYSRKLKKAGSQADEELIQKTNEVRNQVAQEILKAKGSDIFIRNGEID